MCNRGQVLLSEGGFYPISTYRERRFPGLGPRTLATRVGGWSVGECVVPRAGEAHDPLPTISIK
jgi:hypothetical protein